MGRTKQQLLTRLQRPRPWLIQHLASSDPARGHYRSSRQLVELSERDGNTCLNEDGVFVHSHEFQFFSCLSLTSECDDGVRLLEYKSLKFDVRMGCRIGDELAAQPFTTKSTCRKKK